MAENCEPFCQNIAAYIQSRLGIKTAYVNDIPWQERERLFDEGQIQILWLCVLPYVHKADLRENDMELPPFRFGGLSVRAAGIFFRRHRKRRESLSKF
jgi:hypothetical protein